MRPMAKRKPANGRRSQRKQEKPDADRVVVCASLPSEDAARLDAFGTREKARSGLIPRRGTLATMLIRRGLEVVEQEAGIA